MIIMSEMGVAQAEASATPAVNTEVDPDDDVELTGGYETAFRSIAARANYSAMGRADVQFACEGVSLVMAAPKETD